MSIGARKAFEEILGGGEERETLVYPAIHRLRWQPQSRAGMASNGFADGAVFLPPTAGVAVETLVQAIQTKKQAPLRKETNRTVAVVHQVV